MIFGCILSLILSSCLKTLIIPSPFYLIFLSLCSFWADPVTTETNQETKNDEGNFHTLNLIWSWFSLFGLKCIILYCEVMWNSRFYFIVRTGFLQFDQVEKG